MIKDTPTIDKIKKLIYDHRKYNNKKFTSLVVSQDIYYNIQKEEKSFIENCKLYGLLISVLQCDKNNQILLF